jgi:hypothetical protein
MGNIGTALGAAVTVTIEGDITRADLGDALITIATELGRALANDDVDELFAEALADLAERSKSGVARHAAAVLRGRRSWSAMTPRSAARPCASSSSLARR